MEDILYRYIRGSHLYGTNIDGASDVDEGGIFICDKNTFFGLPSNYLPQAGDAKHDHVYYEIGRYCELLIKSNATILEALFVPENKMLQKYNKVLTPLFENRDKFITKDCFKPFVQYSIEQIRKARGLNKKIVNPVAERKGILDFCYTFREQGSTKIKYWLEYRRLKQEYCGLVCIPNMYGIYGVYYDWGKYFEDYNIDLSAFNRLYDVRNSYRDASEIVSDIKNSTSDESRRIHEIELENCYKVNMIKFIIDFYNLYSNEGGFKYTTKEHLENWFKKYSKPIGYRGMVCSDSNTTKLRLSSVSKGEKPICYISYEENGFIKHCVDYKNYKDWEKNRNPERYKLNIGKTYDRKNMCHSMRLMTMGEEIALGKGIILDRNEAGDRDFLLSIRNSELEYDELIKIVEEKKKTMDEAMKNSTIPEHIDKNLINDILIDIRKNYYSS